MSDEETREKPEVFLFDLTDMTGKSAKSNRQVVILTVEMNRASLIAAIVSLFPAALVTLIAVPIVGVWSIIVFAVVFLAFMFAFLGRQRRGLQLKQWRGWADKRRTRTDVFIQCNRVIDPTAVDTRRIVRSSQPNPLLEHIDEEDLTDKVIAQ